MSQSFLYLFSDW